MLHVLVPILLPVVEMDVRIDNAKFSACLHEMMTTFQLRIGHSAAARLDHLNLECTRRSSKFGPTVFALGKYFERKLHSRVFLMDKFTASIEGCSPALSLGECSRIRSTSLLLRGHAWRFFRHCLYATAAVSIAMYALGTRADNARPGNRSGKSLETRTMRGEECNEERRNWKTNSNSFNAVSGIGVDAFDS